MTHSGAGADQLVQAFRSLKATVHHVPLIEFQVLETPQRLSDLRDVQWLVLTSPQGVRALAQVVQGQRVPGGMKWAAVGESTARAMRGAGMPVHFTPSCATGSALGRELPLDTAGTVLHVTSDQSKNDLPDALLARAGQYERLVLYRTLPRSPTSAETAHLLASHAVMLASSSAAQHFALLGGQQVPVVVMGQQTADTARKLGFRQVVVACKPTLSCLQQAAVAFLTRSDC